MKLNKIITIIFIALLVITVDIILAKGIIDKVQTKQSIGSEGETATKCNLATSTKVQIGRYTAATVLATSTRRSYANIQVTDAEPGIVWLSFGDTAVATSGVELANGTIEEKTFGLNTDFPYVGSVTGIVTGATTSVLVTECIY